MDNITTHPSTAFEAKAFTAPTSLSFPGGHDEFNHSAAEKDGYVQQNGQMNGQAVANTNGAANTAGQAGAGVSGIVPTLQNIVSTVSLDCRLDLKTIALHARNAEYNPKVRRFC